MPEGSALQSSDAPLSCASSATAVVSGTREVQSVKLQPEVQVRAEAAVEAPGIPGSVEPEKRLVRPPQSLSVGDAYPVITGIVFTIISFAK